MYNNNIQLKKKDILIFFKIDLLPLWLINIIKCYYQLILAYFIDKNTFASLLNTFLYYINYYYNYIIIDIDKVFTKVFL